MKKTTFKFLTAMVLALGISHAATAEEVAPAGEFSVCQTAATSPVSIFVEARTHYAFAKINCGWKFLGRVEDANFKFIPEAYLIPPNEREETAL